MTEKVLHERNMPGYNDVSKSGDRGNQVGTFTFDVAVDHLPSLTYICVITICNLSNMDR